MGSPDAAKSLIGRQAEMKVVEGVLANVQQSGAALIVRGDPGIGKSTLLAHASRTACEQGMMVLKTVGVESESQLPFAGLHRLLRPVLGGAEELPQPQRNAILGAFGLADDAVPDLFLVALAALDLLCSATAEQPLLLVCEDMHWLDGSSADALAFVARRLDADPIVLIAATRDTGADLSRLDIPELSLGPLDEREARELLDACAPDLPVGLRARVLETAAGNPLALEELPLAWSGSVEAPGLPDSLPLTTRLGRAFAMRTSELPGTTRALLLVAALNDEESLAETLDATSRLVGSEISPDALGPATEAGLVTSDGRRLRFRHPLVRTTIAQSAGVSERLDAHAALAHVLADAPARRVWHRAAATVGPDEAVACELDEAAAHAYRRGAVAGAITALERAAQLSKIQTAKGMRLLRAAELSYELGQLDNVYGFLAEADPLELEPLERARLAWLRDLFGQERWLVGSGVAQARSVVAIAEEMRVGGDSARALDLLFTASLRYWWDNVEEQTLDQIVATADQLPIPEDDPKRLAILAMAAPRERSAEVIDRLTQVTPDAGADPEAMRHLGIAATVVGDMAPSASFLTAAVAGLRAQGRLGVLAQALVSQANTAFHLGSWSLAGSAADESARLARETAQPRLEAMAFLSQGLVAAVRGETEAARALAAQAEATAMPNGVTPMLALVQLVRGEAALAEGDHLAAYAELCRMFDPADTAFHPALRAWAVADIAEAAAHSGHEEEARVLLDELESVAAETHSPLLAAHLKFARALLAPEQQTEVRFQPWEATDRATWPFVHGRFLLAHGSRLRRQRRAADSRPVLRLARDELDALGAAPWAERARQELRASGETSRRREPAARDQLTPQELQIAQMAAEGMTNRDIGQRLYLSHRTVGYHLYRVFPKLRITSRAELARTLELAESSAAD